MPLRKKPRPDPADSSPDNAPPSPSEPSTMPPTRLPKEPSSSVETKPEEQTVGSSPPRGTRQSRPLKKAPSWYGSFPRVGKATSSTAITKETAIGGTLRPQASVDFSRYDLGRGSDTASLRSATESANGPALNTARKVKDDTTRGSTGVNTPAPTASAIPTQSSAVTAINPASDSTSAKPARSGPKAPESASPTNHHDAEPRDDDDAKSTTDSILSPPMPSTPARPSTPVGWLEWLRWGGETQPSQVVPSTEEKPEQAAKATETKAEEQSLNQEPAASDAELTSPSQNPLEPTRPGTSNGGGWLDYLWAALPAASAEQAAPQEAPKEEGASDLTPAISTATQDVSLAVDPQSAAAPPTSPAAGSTWAFWSRDSGTKGSRAPSSKEPGEIAVIGETSESHPTPADRKQIDPSRVELKDSVKGKKTDKGINDALVKDSKRLTPKTQDKSKPVKGEDKDDKKVDSEIVKANDAKPRSWRAGKTKRVPADTLEGQKTSATPTDEPTPSIKSGVDVATPFPVTEAALSAPQASSNLLLPSFDSTYSMKDNPSITRQIGRLLLRSTPITLPSLTASTPLASGHSSLQVFRTKKAPKIQRAVAIGVHGLFPNSYLRAMIGQPTGTSLRFASLCAESIRRWVDANGSPGCEIEKVALEGEGKIAERVDNLWKLLMNWEDHLRQADLIILACHSQGVPVGIMLLSKLIELNIITHARIGVCAMAGVSLGPFPYRTASMLGGSAAELLEFANPESAVAQNYEHALGVVLGYGGRITYIGSIDDQLVPMESAVHSPLHHPYIYRAVFVDGRIHAPDFLAHLIGFALKLRNLGISDHGLIRELSSPLAGSLYTGEGHSRLYFDAQVYNLAIQHALETTDVPAHTPPAFRRPASGAVGVANANPYHLPWIMRGLLEEGRIKTELSDETAALVQKFDDWNPVSARLKEVKYKLEAIKSHL